MREASGRCLLHAPLQGPSLQPGHVPRGSHRGHGTATFIGPQGGQVGPRPGAAGSQLTRCWLSSPAVARAEVLAPAPSAGACGLRRLPAFFLCSPCGPSPATVG